MDNINFISSLKLQETKTHNTSKLIVQNTTVITYKIVLIILKVLMIKKE